MPVHPNGGGRTRGRAQILGPLLLYVGASVLLFGVPVLLHPRGRFIGWGNDPSLIVWFVKWWPYAIAHGTNPFVTHVVWAPTGSNLAGAASIPGLALAGTPLTVTAGPVVAYNVIYLLAPALSAWTAYLLCRRLTGAFLPSLVGGYLFGFSTYELGRMTSQLHLAMVFVVPLAVLLVVDRIDGRITRVRFVVLLALALTFQFLVSTEVLFTLTVFGWVALMGALLVLPRDRMKTLAGTGGEIVAAYGCAAVLLSPYLFYVIKGLGEAPVYSFYPTFYSTDLANFVVPNALTLFGWANFASLTAKFTGNVSEQAAYVGIPLLVILGLFAWREWRRPATRLLLIVLGAAFVTTLGPKLHVLGKERFWLPWKLVASLPFVKYALPGRFMLYGFLALAVVAALWLTSPRTWQPAKWILVPAAVLLLLPNVHGPFWSSRVDVPGFFRDGMFRQYLVAGENTLVIPYGDRGESMLWQVESGLSFRMAGGYVAVVPPKEFRDLPILRTFYTGQVIPNADQELRTFLVDHDVGAVIVADGYPGPWVELFSGLDPHPVDVGGVTLYRVPIDALSG